MRLVTYETSTGPAFGRVEGDSIFPLGTDLREWLAAEGPGAVDDALGATGDPAAGALATSDRTAGGPTAGDPAARAPLALESVRLLAPIPAPGKIVCIGLNYRDHAAEAGLPLPEEPVLFAKFANSVVGTGAPIVVPRAVRRVDYEAELGVVIGRRARRVAVEEALGFVAGYLCANDVSARDLQPKNGQWTRGKAVDTFLPTGPWLVTADEIPDPQALAIRCTVSGEVLQESNTSEMVFGVAELVSFISATMTLEPGDLIVTGTPAGVGFVRRPPRWLEPGDTVSVDIEGIGRLTNAVERE
ncbi:MAG: fumarylacetoacetate hydrolase family protein [Thermoleophilia bacterium]